jgi:hypothetical protein
LVHWVERRLGLACVLVGVSRRTEVALAATNPLSSLVDAVGARDGPYDCDGLRYVLGRPAARPHMLDAREHDVADSVLQVVVGADAPGRENRPNDFEHGGVVKEGVRHRRRSAYCNGRKKSTHTPVTQNARWRGWG